MTITQVVVHTAPFSTATWLDGRRIATPMSRWGRFAERRSSWRGPGADLVWVLLRTDDDEVYGIGQTRGGAVTAALIESHLGPLLVGEGVGAIADRTSQLRLAALPYADGGIGSMAVSAIELALWDLAARAVRAPLVSLLGGSREEPPAHYLTVPDVDALDAVDPDLIASATAVKIPAAYGPVDGLRGRDGVVAQLREVREHVPDHVPLAIDCFMSWDVEFTLAVARAAESLELAWVEEPLLPRDLDGYSELSRALGPVALAGGEHLFGLQDAAAFVQRRCAQLLQVDVTWCGGLTVAATAGRLAVEAGMTFAPHAAGLQPWATHLVWSFGPDVLIEVLLRIDGAGEVPRPGAGPGVGLTPEQVGFS
jgi:L-rhamnonate dehydratase